MPRGPIQRVQDSVHGLMEFRGMETIVIEVLRTPETQRLRRIRQLGMAHLVFPGAEHSRLVHSLGAAHLAIRFGRHLQETARSGLVEMLCPKASSIRDLAVAALCHDLGHGPLSHAWEHAVVGEDYDFDRWSDSLGLSDHKEQLRGLKWHELVTQALLSWKSGQLHQLLEQHEDGFSERLRYLLRGQYYIPYLPRLLSGDIDIDRADFVRRDTHLCGVAYGRYDLNWLISTCSVGHTDSNELVIGFDARKSLRVVEQFLIARAAMYETVYYHRTVRSAEGMVGLFLKRLKEVLREEQRSLDVAAFVRPLVKMISGEFLEPAEILSLDDFSLWVLLDNVSQLDKMDVTAKDLAQRIVSRDLFKLVPCDSNKVSKFLRKKDGYERIYDVIEPFCVGKREFYLVEDTLSFNMLCSKPAEIAYFIDDARHAKPIREHPSLRHHWKETEETVRHFTVAEAVDAVKALIG